jgi:hypothetical protein
MYTRQEILKAMEDVDEFRDYGSYRIPCERDRMILALLREVKDQRSFQEVLGPLNLRQIYGGLLGFAARAHK